MSTAASILVTFQSISEASQNTKATASYMNQELDQLKRDLSQLKALWDGQAAKRIVEILLKVVPRAKAS